MSITVIGFGEKPPGLPSNSIDDARPQAEAQHFLSVYFGLRVLAKAGHPVTALKDAKKTALCSILPSG